MHGEVIHADALARCPASRKHWMNVNDSNTVFMMKEFVKDHRNQVDWWIWTRLSGSRAQHYLLCHTSGKEDLLS